MTHELGEYVTIMRTLERIERRQELLDRKLGKFMTTVDSRFQRAEDALSRTDAAVSGIRGDISVLAQELKDAIANASGLSADDSAALDAVVTHAEALAGTSEELDTENPAPAPEPVV